MRQKDLRQFTWNGDSVFVDVADQRHPKAGEELRGCRYPIYRRRGDKKPYSMVPAVVVKNVFNVAVEVAS